MQLKLDFTPKAAHPYQRIGEDESVSDQPLRQAQRPRVQASQPTRKTLTCDWHEMPSGNPYASILDQENETESAPFDTCSKKNFERTAKKILLQYSPSIGKRRTISPEFQDLISFGLAQDGSRRAEILKGLSRYDLNASGIGLALANRSVDPQVLKKLGKIFRVQ